MPAKKATKKANKAEIETLTSDMSELLLAHYDGQIDEANAEPTDKELADDPDIGAKKKKDAYGAIARDVDHILRDMVSPEFMQSVREKLAN